MQNTGTVRNSTGRENRRVWSVACRSGRPSAGSPSTEDRRNRDAGAIEAVRATGATPSQVFFNAVLPAVMPQYVSSHLYIWEFNIRDSTILGLIGAGGLGLLISESVSLFQWDRLATILLVVVVLVTTFDAMSRRIRQRLL